MLTLATILAVMTWKQLLLSIALIGVCLFLMLVILVQRGRGGGLVSAFGGTSGMSAFGSKTGDVFTWITVVVAGIFVLLSVLGNYAFDASRATVATATPSTTTTTIPATPVDPNSLPAGLPPGAVPIQAPNVPSGQSQTVKFQPGSGSNPPALVPTTTPPAGTNPAQPTAPSGSGTTPSQPGGATSPAAPGSNPPATAPGGNAGTPPTTPPANPPPATTGDSKPADEKPKEEPKNP